MKKVAFIVSEYNEKFFYGGGEKVNSYIVQELLNRNYFVDIYTDISYVEKSDFVNIYIKDDNFEKNYQTLLKNYDLLLSTNIEYVSDITYSHNHSYIFEKELVKTPLILEKLFSKSYKKKFQKYLNSKINSNKISKIVVSSNIVKEDYIKNYQIPEWKLYVLPPGVDYHTKNIKIPKRECFIFGLVARGFENKGGYITLFAINELKKRNKNFKVRIINQNAKRNLFVQLIVKLLGLQNYIEFLPLQKDMTDFYNSIDCLLAPSKKESFGLIVTEAMSFSKPVILSSVCGAKDLIKDNENGLIVDCSSSNRSKMLAEKMEKVINLSDSDYSILCENAWNTVKDIQYDKFAKEYINLAEKEVFIEKPKISVVIPVYNSEKYLPECLNSILNQSIKDIEIICINDGSTDNSLNILEKYAKSDRRIKLISQKNQGIGKARNVGIQSANGEYIFFIDSDDFISQDYLENMYRNAKEADADLVINDNVDIFWNDNLKTKKKYIKNRCDDGIYSLTPEFVKNRHNNSLAWTKLYKLDILKKNNIVFVENYIYEDEHFYYTALPFYNKILQYNIGSYFYRQHKKSIMGEGKTDRKYDIFIVFREIYKFYVDNNLINYYELPYTILKYRSSQISDYKRYRKEFLKLIKELNLDINEIKKNKKLWSLYISDNKFLYRINSLFWKKRISNISDEYNMLNDVDEY